MMRKFYMISYSMYTSFKYNRPKSIKFFSLSTVNMTHVLPIEIVRSKKYLLGDIENNPM